MGADAHKPVGLPYNGAMMRWSRERRKLSIDEAAEKIGVLPDRIRDWECGNDVPTLRQGRSLAEFYKRPFLEFFYDTPPEITESTLLPDFRVHRGASDPRQNVEILEVQHWAEAQRLNALDLYEQVGESPPVFPKQLFATIDDDPEESANKARETLGFPIAKQRRLTQKEFGDIPGILRNCIESVGALVFRENTLINFDVSGLCIVQFPLPVIIFASESPGRQAFTLMHEFAHILLRESAISGREPAKKSSAHDRRVERWCDQFAGAFLVPANALAQLRGEPDAPAAQIADEALNELARSFRVSPHAMLIRLVHLGYVNPDYYWNIKYQNFLDEEAKWKAGGRPRYYASRFVNKLGNLYTNLVLEAWGTNRIPFHQAADFMGLRNFSHLPSIRQEFRGS